MLSEYVAFAHTCHDLRCDSWHRVSWLTPSLPVTALLCHWLHMDTKAFPVPVSDPHLGGICGRSLSLLNGYKEDRF